MNTIPHGPLRNGRVLKKRTRADAASRVWDLVDIFQASEELARENLSVDDAVFALKLWRPNFFAKLKKAVNKL
jgi:hypothetical protein